MEEIPRHVPVIKLSTYPPWGVFFCYIKDMNKNLEIVRSFFTDSEWDAIDSALSDYQDYGDRETELMNSIGDKMDKLFNA